MELHRYPGMRRSVRKLFSVVFWMFFGISCFANFAVALLLFAVTAPVDRDRRVLHIWACCWATMYAVTMPGWKFRVTGRKNIRSRTPYVIVANHTSIADIVLCFGLFKQFKWISKKEVFSYPLLGWNMRLCKYIPLIRGDRQSISAMWQACYAWLDRGISILMFPEGTRSQDGRLRSFKHGAFTMALESGVDIVPVAIHGGHSLIPKHGSQFAPRADLWVEVLEPMPHGDYDSAEAYGEAVRQRIAAALGTGVIEDPPRASACAASVSISTDI